jgi:hypothetical protein
MKAQPRIHKIFCGELCKNYSSHDNHSVCLSYYDYNDVTSNMKVEFAKFVDKNDAFEPKIIDLLEIAAYVFTADRSVFRGDTSNLTNNSWARSFEFYIPVRDCTFWEKEETKNKLSLALKYMTGDRKYVFNFYKYEHPQNFFDNQIPTLFNSEDLAGNKSENIEIMIFSGGLDSLAGAIEFLNKNPQKTLCLVSHKSSKGTIHTQATLVSYLKKRYGNRIKYYGFGCHYTKVAKSDEETQRTRMFLFSAIAYSTCSVFGLDGFLIYENGVTSINLSKQADVINARASRTTHPKTMALLKNFYMLFNEKIQLKTPFMYSTKTDVMQIFKKHKECDIIASAVSCSSTRKNTTFTHCGCCSQCIDRKFAIYASGLENYDATYMNEFITSDNDNPTLQMLYNTLRFAFEIKNKSDFITRYFDPLLDVIDNLPGDNPQDKTDEVYKLFCRYSDSIFLALQRIRNDYDDLHNKFPDNSLIQMINKKTYLNTPFARKVSEIDIILKESIPTMFKNQKPLNEIDFNSKIQAILKAYGKFEREYPVLRFGTTVYQADHSQDELLLESKYIRGKTTQSKIYPQLSHDILSKPSAFGLFFVIYDPERNITEDSKFIESIQNRRENCFIRIYR